jgi:glucokinase
MQRFAIELLAGQAPAAIGVSFGGPVDARAGLVQLSHHVPGWENIPLQQLLGDTFDAPVSVDNDANAAALGEHRFGAGRGYHHLMYVTVSTGVGGGWVLNDRPWQGHEGMAGEIGHMVVDPSGPVCLCGKRGCVERLASGPFMAQELQVVWTADPTQAAAVGVAFEPGMSVTGKMVAEAAAAGDEAASQILLRGARGLGVALGNTANLINPQLFVLGGGVTKSAAGWWPAVRRAARDTALLQVHFEVVPADLADDAPLWGAVALALDLLA